MMYQYIAKEIKSMKFENSHPLDYLNFYCLGNREKITGPAAQISGDASKVGTDLSFLVFGIIKYINVLCDDMINDYPNRVGTGK